MRSLAVLALAASSLVAQSGAPKAVLGTVTEFKVETLELGVKPDDGAPRFIPFSAATEVMQVAPGDRDLKNAKAMSVTNIASGDRVLMSFVDGLVEARRIVVVSAGEIARRNDAERADWKRRGISGVVSARNGNEITLTLRTVDSRSAVITLNGKTRIRRYATDSVKFSDARPAAGDEIAVGDQLQARGEKSEDGSRLAAEDVVFGTFLTKMGSVTAVNLEKHEIEVQENGTGKALTIRIGSGSQIKKMPDMKALFGSMINAAQHKAEAVHSGAAPAGSQGPPDVAQFIETLPLERLEDLKPGESIAVASTRSADGARLTAILVLANADFLVQMAKAQAAGPGQSSGLMDGILKGHGNMLGGPGGLSIPAIVQ